MHDHEVHNNAVIYTAQKDLREQVTGTHVVSSLKYLEQVYCSKYI